MEIGFPVYWKMVHWCLDTEKFSFDLTFADPSDNQVFRYYRYSLGTIKALEIANPSLC